MVSPRGLGFHWYRTTLLRITRYEHPIDYLPRDFADGRVIAFRDQATGRVHELLPGGRDLICAHRPGSSTFSGTTGDLAFECTVLVPDDEPAEFWMIHVANLAGVAIHGTITFTQVWSIAHFGIHTAEEGIPYISTPGKDLRIKTSRFGIEAQSTNPERPLTIRAGLFSPQCRTARAAPLEEQRPGKPVFVFHQVTIEMPVSLDPGQTCDLDVAATATEDEDATERIRQLTRHPGFARKARDIVTEQWRMRIAQPSCRIPDESLQRFLNVWFKNQLHLTFHFCRSGHHGYRDSLQDAWGYTLVDPEHARQKLRHVLAHQNSDGSAPRNFSALGDGRHDHRRFMDSPVWIARTLVDLVKETGDTGWLDEQVPFLDGSSASVEEHAWRALEVLYRNRNHQGLCHTGDGDWNDALEGISRDGEAVSAWLTMALADAMHHMIELYAFTRRKDRHIILQQRFDELRAALNEVAWDGQWYVYGFTGKGQPIGSHRNREGRIHLNAQAWAVFSGVADRQRAALAMASVRDHLDTPLGPALLAPPYVHEGNEVGRIARLEPGTFENGAVYQHAVAFHILALLTQRKAEEALDALRRILPSNPENFDGRRTSEPYCTGNYYCGPGHPRFGQNFFSWFTGNAAWFLRIGFDHLRGVRAGFKGLEINPCAPADWNSFEVTRRYRGCLYRIRFEKTHTDTPFHIKVDGRSIEGCQIPPCQNTSCDVIVKW